MTALIQASEGGHSGVVDRLMAESPIYDRVLIVACIGGYIGVVNLLVNGRVPKKSDYRTSINQGNLIDNERAILMQGIWTRATKQFNGTVDTKAGAALVGAVAGGHLPVVQALLTAGAALDSCSSRLIALLTASKCGHNLIVRELLHRRKIEYLVPSLTEDLNVPRLLSIHYQGIVSLAAAYRKNKRKLVEIFLDNGVDVNAILIEENFSPLREAVLRNDLLALEIMIDAGADLRAHGSRTLIMACTFNRIDIVRKLLSLGVNVNSYDLWLEGSTPTERSPIAAAVQHADCDVLVALLNSGAEVNFQHSNETVLHYACNTTIHCAEKVQLLLDAGADIHARDMYSRTALEVAVMNGEGRAAATLRSAGAQAATSWVEDVHPAVLRARELAEAIHGREHMMPSEVFELEAPAVEVPPLEVFELP